MIKKKDLVNKYIKKYSKIGDIKIWKREELIFSQLSLLSKSESVKFSLIESVICLFIDSSVKK